MNTLQDHPPQDRTSPDGLSPEDFTETAAKAVSSCACLDCAESARRLAADGLLGVLADEGVGGLGLTLPYAVPIAAQAAAGLLAFPLVETVLLVRELAVSVPDLAGRLVAGDGIATVAWIGAADAVSDGDGLRLSGTVARAPLADRAAHVLVAIEDGSAAIVPTAAPGVAVEAGLSLSLETPDHMVTLAGVFVAAAAVLPREAVAALRRDALVLRAAAILGSAEASLAMAVAHVTDRRQFGKALVANQAVRHMLARQKLALEGIRSAIGRCVLAPAPSDLLARAAFLHAAEAGAAIAETAIQLYGGMGFTWDVPVHRHLRLIRSLAMRDDAGALYDAMAEDLTGARVAA